MIKLPWLCIIEAVHYNYLTAIYYLASFYVFFIWFFNKFESKINMLDKFLKYNKYYQDCLGEL